MSFLLDTHTFIWALTDPGRIPINVRNIVEDADNELFVSAVSFWEIAIKVRSGRLAPVGRPSSNIVEAAEAMGFLPIPLLPEEAATSANLIEDTHFDPFDRMLIWQAISRKMVLISGDSEFKRFKKDGLKLLWK
ncbi:MAG: type II toxin-antitoxin system VapC family toxin [Pyrinomonadaceae bacterium]